MKKIILASLISLLITGCQSSPEKSMVNNYLTFSSSFDKEITLVKGKTTVQEVQNELGTPENMKRNGRKVMYEYTSSHLFRDVATGLLIGWQFLDNHVLTLCEPDMKDCKLFKAEGNDDKAKSLRIYFNKGVVSDAQLVVTDEALKQTLGF